jgi:hypothetical protein
MVRNLKVLIGALFVLSVLGAVYASAGKAAEFHCSVEPCRYTFKPDGTAKNSHHVIIIENEAKTESVSFTCSKLEGEGTSASKTSTERTFSTVAYKECSVNGSPPVSPHGICFIVFYSNGDVLIGCALIFTVTNCTITIPEQKISGTSYTTVGSTPNREITASITGTATGVTASDPCAFINPKQKLIARFTTGNVLLTGETTGGVMADAWYA